MSGMRWKESRPFLCGRQPGMYRVFGVYYGKGQFGGMNMENALTVDDVKNMLELLSDGIVLVNGSDQYTITYDYNNGNSIVDIRNKE